MVRGPEPSLLPAREDPGPIREAMGVSNGALGVSGEGGETPRVNSVNGKNCRPSPNGNNPQKSVLAPEIHGGGVEGQDDQGAPGENEEEPWDDSYPAEGDPDFEEPRKVARVGGKWGEYLLDPKWRFWALQQMGVESLPIMVDLFSSPWNAAAPLYITKEMDAFSFDWSKLQGGEEALLWANPPFKELPRVAEKILREPCRVAVCTPEWVDDPWWKTFQRIPHALQRLPTRRKLFFGAFRKVALPQKNWRTVVWLLDSRQSALEEGSRQTGEGAPILRGLTELRQEVARMPKSQWPHQIRGGEMMRPGCALKQTADVAADTDTLGVERGVRVTESTQTYLSWAEWPDQPLCPEEQGWGITGNYGSSDRATRRVQACAWANGVESPITVSDTSAQTNMHWSRTNIALPEAQACAPGTYQLPGDPRSTEIRTLGISEAKETQTDEVLPPEAHIRGGVRVLGHGIDQNRPTGILEAHLRILASLHQGDLPGYQASVLIDTGAEASLIRKGLMPASAFRKSANPLRLVAANQSCLPGGHLEVEVDIHLNATDVETKEKRVARIPTILYEAEIDEDIILSYRWMGER